MQLIYLFKYIRHDDVRFMHLQSNADATAWKHDNHRPMGTSDSTLESV